MTVSPTCLNTHFPRGTAPVRAQFFEHDFLQSTVSSLGLWVLHWPGRTQRSVLGSHPWPLPQRFALCAQHSHLARDRKPRFQKGAPGCRVDSCGTISSL